ncbi:MAG: hypothetical protein KDE26_27965, partial [Bacteroidetes bacterium]|nr:hypothetical protein [Bacteroidota bacterium]
SKLIFRTVDPLPFFLKAKEAKNATDQKDPVNPFDKHYYLRLVAKGEANRAIDRLLSDGFVQDRQTHYETLVLLSAKNEKIQQDWTKGTLAYEVYNLENARIADTLIEFLNKLERDPVALPLNSGILISDFVMDYRFNFESKKNELNLDIKILNNSDEIVILNRFNIAVSEVAAAAHENQWLESSHTYEVKEVTLKKAGDEFELPISQFINPRSVDRFEIHIQNCQLGEVPILFQTSFHTSKGLLMGPEMGAFVIF